MVRDTRPDEVEYKGRSVTFDQPGWYCTACDEAVLDGPDAAVANEAFVDLRAEVDGLLTPHEIACIRTKLGLSQRQAGAVLGGGPRAFQKYESGTDWVTRAMANLLRVLDRDPGAIEVLIAISNERRSTKGQGSRRRTRSPSQAQPHRASGNS
jgi:HTH-type transcriptional regulator/antitoxin MqsA